MTNPRKRSADSAAVSGPVYTSNPAKKRKMDNAQKWYAVRVGRKPGVYSVYADCLEQINKFPGALFKSFTNYEDAEAYKNGKDVASADQPIRFYAVAVGQETGIFNDWITVQKSITGFKGPKYKRFDTRSEAVWYIKQFGDKETIEKLGLKDDSSDRLTKRAPAAASSKSSKAKSDEDSASPAEDCIDIYTDGSSLANGQAGARAGVGVYFGDGDERNVSEPLMSEPQTNQRAELMAILRALGAVSLDRDVQIVTDSKYSINCVTQWAISWEKKGWLNSKGEEVKNQDIIRAVLKRMKERTENGGTTFFKWVKGHDKDRGNIEADRLAVQGAKMAA